MTEVWTAPKDMDQECVALCSALNLLPGIRTIESCCGHGNYPYRIWFIAENLEALPPALYYFDNCHCGFRGWSVKATTDCAMSPVHFMIEGPIGDEATEQSFSIAARIVHYKPEVGDD